MNIRDRVIGRDGIYDNTLNVLEKCARSYAARMLWKHGITILTIHTTV